MDSSQIAGRDAATESLFGRFLEWHWSSLLLTVLAFLLCLAAWRVTSPETLLAIMSEEGPVELAGAILLGIAALALALRARTDDPRFFLSSALLVAIMSARELDLDHAFTSESIFSIRFYSFPSVPLMQKLLVGPFVLSLGLFVLDYARRFGPPLLRGLLLRRAGAFSVANVLFLIAFSLTLDGAGRKLRALFGVELPQNAIRPLLAALEEGMELMIPVVILWGLWQAVREHGARRSFAS